MQNFKDWCERYELDVNAIEENTDNSFTRETRKHFLMGYLVGNREASTEFLMKILIPYMLKDDMRNKLKELKIYESFDQYKDKLDEEYKKNKN